MAAGEARVASRDYATAATPGSSAPVRAAGRRGPAVLVVAVGAVLAGVAFAPASVGAAHGMTPASSLAGTRHPAARDEHTELSVSRQALAYGSFALLAAIVLPWPT